MTLQVRRPTKGYVTAPYRNDRNDGNDRDDQQSTSGGFATLTVYVGSLEEVSTILSAITATTYDYSGDRRIAAAMSTQ